jgi:hypothetical protein
MSNDNYKGRKRNQQAGMADTAFQMLEKGFAKLIERIFSKNNFAVYPAGELTRMWQNIESMDPKMALIEADKLVDTVLKKSGVRGESLGERLRNVQKLVSRGAYNDMWEAHKIRNKLVHEFDHGIESRESASAIWKMRRFLTDLGVFKNG